MSPTIEADVSAEPAAGSGGYDFFGNLIEITTREPGQLTRYHSPRGSGR